MAGQEIYLGKMIESLQTDIATVVSTLNQHTIELGNINTVVAQGINSINVKASDNKKFDFLNALEGTTSNTEVVLISFAALCDGSIKLGAQYYSSTSLQYARIHYKINSGAWTQLDQTNQLVGNPKSVSWNINVKKNDVVYIGMSVTNTATGYIKENSVTASYDLIDILNNGAIAII